MIKRKIGSSQNLQRRGIPSRAGRLMARRIGAVQRKITARKRKQSSLRKLKIELEKLQKQIVLKKYGNDCYTCDAKNLQGKNCHLGHVPWPRSILSTECKYDIRYTRAQCMRDNIHYGGMGAVALKRMQDEGEDTKAMWQLNTDTKGKTYSAAWFEEKVADYKAILGLSTPSNESI